ncbi:N-acetylmuramoyl-L-alanine amidase-like domain-containing protein [Roseibium album]|uniref:N-acetylmuramoyl-L-alanine amidase-like domain-containing protein n=1 Tax=Roseibium album TaxID=311410 RepID=UPI0024909935|nr:N-acetylmuramoyl-L-alanine amidase-like domain-containing protein [Roseibium album]
MRIEITAREAGANNDPSGTGWDRPAMPLSDAQRRMWYMAQRDPGNVFYNVTIACDLDPACDVILLEQSLVDVVTRHEILRTVYPEEQGEPSQSVQAPTGFGLRRVMAHEGGKGAEAALRAEAESIAQTVLDLAAGPVFQAYLVSLDTGARALVLLSHHIAIDQHSINVLLADLETAYDARQAGRAPGFLPIPTYRDYTAWSRERFVRREQALLGYWRGVLAAPPSPLPLPLGNGGEERGQVGGEQSFEIGAEETRALKRLCRETRATPFIVLLAAFAALLQARSGRRRFFVGTTTAFRGDACFNNTLGCFINTLAIPVQVDPSDTVDALIRRTRSDVIDAFGSYELSYERLVQLCRAMHPTGDPQPVNVYFQFQPGRLVGGDPGRRFKPSINVHNGRAKFPLMLNASDLGDRISCTFEFERERFSAADIRALQDAFLTILAGFLQAEPGTDALPGLLHWSTDPKWQSPEEATVRNEPVDPGAGEADWSETEERIATIWEDLLGTRPVSNADSFAALGGHSLLAARLAWRLRQEVGANLRLAELQTADTLAAMAVLAETAVSRLATAAPPVKVLTRIGGISCQFELGIWTMRELEALIVPSAGEGIGARVARIGWAFAGSPFQFDSRRPLPPKGVLGVRLGTFDCYTYVLTVLALAQSVSLEDFVRRLASLRYRDISQIDSHPETGTIFDFAEEALLLNGTRRGLLRDVTAEIAGADGCERVSSVLEPIRRLPEVDPDELWATPKLGTRETVARMIHRDGFQCLKESSGLCAGDVLLMSRGRVVGGFVDHLGIVDMDEEGPHLLQCTRHFALHGQARPAGGGLFTGIFYDEDRRCEQIGVGVAGRHAGEEHALTIGGVIMHGYHVCGKRPLIDYLEGAFTGVIVLRPVAPGI